LRWRLHVMVQHARLAPWPRSRSRRCGLSPPLVRCPPLPAALLAMTYRNTTTLTWLALECCRCRLTVAISFWRLCECWEFHMPLQLARPFLPWHGLACAPGRGPPSRCGTTVCCPGRRCPSRRGTQQPPGAARLSFPPSAAAAGMLWPMPARVWCEMSGVKCTH